MPDKVVLYSFLLATLPLLTRPGQYLYVAWATAEKVQTG
jgi:hypothetical protein